MKMRTLTSGKNKKILAIANAVNVACESTYKVDTIYQPAYACDKERLVVVAGPVKDSMPDIYARTLRSYKKSITANVAFIVEGTEEKSAAALEKYKAMIREAGANVIDDVLYVKTSLFGGKPSAEELANAEAWAKRVIAALA